MFIKSVTLLAGVSVLLSGCLFFDAQVPVSSSVASTVEWRESISQPIDPPWLLCVMLVSPPCIIAQQEAVYSLTFARENATILGFAATVTFPHPNDTLPAPTSFQKLVATVECDDSERGDCQTFAGPLVFDGHSPLEINVEDVALPPGTTLQLAFRYYDPSPVDWLMVEFDAYQYGGLEGTLHLRTEVVTE